MDVVGLIAGLGRLPIEVALAAREGGTRVVAIGLHGLTEASLADEVESFAWVHVGEVAPMMAHFREAGAKTLVMAGKVPKTFLWERPDLVKPDARALQALAGLKDRKDDSLLGAFAGLLVEEGFSLLGQAELAPALLAEVGILGSVEPGPEELADIEFGWPIAKAIGELDVGQTVVVRGKAVLALEAVEGTDAAVERGCALGEPGATVVKVAKPAQDMRFDVPTIGLATVQALARGGARALAVEAGKTVVLEREALLAEADRHGIAVVGSRSGRLDVGEGDR
ncbi:MAG: LpxI family protein [bacterium]|nr:LpxI family protein [bacterium]